MNAISFSTVSQVDVSLCVRWLKPDFKFDIDHQLYIIMERRVI